MRYAVVILLLHMSTRSPSAAPPGPLCTPDGPLVAVPELSEGSGAAASRRHPGRVWSLNDSGGPDLIALNDRGAAIGRLRITGARVMDWEAIAVGPCPAGSCIYVGDIGDNGARRRSIVIYRAAEPDAPSGTVNAEAIQATYPDGPQDAEALLLTPAGDLVIVTKGETGPVGVYRLPRSAQPGATVMLERSGPPRGHAPAPAADRITDGAVSPDGTWIALRTNHDLRFHRTADLLAGRQTDQGRVDLRSLREPQGEGIAFATDSTIYLVGEGGESHAGTFTRLACRF